MSIGALDEPQLEVSRLNLWCMQRHFNPSITSGRNPSGNPLQPSKKIHLHGYVEMSLNDWIIWIYPIKVETRDQGPVGTLAKAQRDHLWHLGWRDPAAVVSCLHRYPGTSSQECCVQRKSKTANYLGAHRLEGSWRMLRIWSHLAAIKSELQISLAFLGILGHSAAKSSLSGCEDSPECHRAIISSHLPERGERILQYLATPLTTQ